MEEKIILANVNFLMEGDNVWLAKKTRRIGIGLLNGYGGGVETYEKSIIDSSIREIREECGIETQTENFEKVAIIDFHDTKDDGSILIIRVYAYIVRGWKGIPKETEEMADPKPYNKNNLPLDQMMGADKKWVPLVMQGKKVIATFYYDSSYKLTKEGPLEIVDSLPD